MYPFRAVYAYTPSKLPSSVAVHLKPGLTEQIDGDQDMVVKPMPSLSLPASDARSVRNGSLDDIELATNDRETSSYGSGEGIGTMIVYSRRTEGLNGSAVLNHGGGVSVGSAGCLTQSGIRRSCSLDGVALASRCHGDESLMYHHHGGVDRTRDDSSDEDCHYSQGDKLSFSSSSGSINSRSICLLLVSLLEFLFAYFAHYL